MKISKISERYISEVIRDVELREQAFVQAISPGYIDVDLACKAVHKSPCRLMRRIARLEAQAKGNK